MNLTVLDASINRDTVLYTRKIDNNVLKFSRYMRSCVFADHKLEASRAVKYILYTSPGQIFIKGEQVLMIVSSHELSLKDKSKFCDQTRPLRSWNSVCYAPPVMSLGITSYTIAGSRNVVFGAWNSLLLFRDKLFDFQKSNFHLSGQIVCMFNRGLIPLKSIS